MRAKIAEESLLARDTITKEAEMALKGEFVAKQSKISG